MAAKTKIKSNVISMNKLVNSMRTLARQRIIVYTLLGGRKKNN